MMTPPMIAWPIGAWMSPPSLSAMSIGSMPKIIASGRLAMIAIG